MILAITDCGYDGMSVQDYDSLEHFLSSISERDLSATEAYVVTRELNVREEYENFQNQKKTLRANILKKLTPFEQRILGVS